MIEALPQVYYKLQNTFYFIYVNNKHAVNTTTGMLNANNEYHL